MNKQTRKNVGPIKAAAHSLVAYGIHEVSAKEMLDFLRSLHLIDHNNARAIGDVMGNHVGGLALKSRKKGGVVVYDLTQLVVTKPIGQENQREAMVLTIAEVSYKSVLKAELDNADPEIRARVMLVAENVVDALVASKLIALPT